MIAFVEARLNQRLLCFAKSNQIRNLFWDWRCATILYESIVRTDYLVDVFTHSFFCSCPFQEGRGLDKPHVQKFQNIIIIDVEMPQGGSFLCLLLALLPPFALFAVLLLVAVTVIPGISHCPKMHGPERRGVCTFQMHRNENAWGNNSRNKGT